MRHTSRPFIILVALSFLSCIVVSYPLWLAYRDFPTVPISETFIERSGHFSAFLLGGMGICLILAVCRQYQRPWIFLFTTLFFISVVLDQNRLQPWAYQFGIFLLVVGINKNIGLAAVYIMIPFLYFWSGVQKLNLNFYFKVVPWFITPLNEQGDLIYSSMLVALLTSPFIEIIFGILLFLSSFRKFAVIGLIFLHIGILAIIGPLGINTNSVIWPWNIAQILLLIFCFWKNNHTGIDHLKEVKSNLPCAFLVILFCVMPVLNRAGYWDSYLSFALYSGDTTYAEIEIPNNEVHLLGLHAKSIAIPSAHDSAISIIKVFDWAEYELNTPPYPEPRIYKSIFSSVCQKTNNPPLAKLRIYLRPLVTQSQSIIYIQNCSNITR